MSTFLSLSAQSNEPSFLPWALTQVPGVTMGVALSECVPFSECVRMEFSHPFYVTLGLIVHHNWGYTFRTNLWFPWVYMTPVGPSYASVPLSCPQVWCLWLALQPLFSRSLRFAVVILFLAHRKLTRKLLTRQNWKGTSDNEIKGETVSENTAGSSVHTWKLSSTFINNQ